MLSLLIVSSCKSQPSSSQRSLQPCPLPKGSNSTTPAETAVVNLPRRHISPTATPTLADACLWEASSNPSVSVAAHRSTAPCGLETAAPELLRMWAFTMERSETFHEFAFFSPLQVIRRGREADGTL